LYSCDPFLTGWREIQPEDGTTRHRVNLDQPAMVGDNACDHRKAKTATTGLSGHEGIENVITKIRRDARPVIDDLDLNRHMQSRRAGPVQASPPRI
jgi:hypothetical protein